MTGVVVRPVRSTRDRRSFLTMPWRVYRGDSLWVPPLLREHRQRIDPRRGAFFQRGPVELFVAWRGQFDTLRAVLKRLPAGQGR